MNEQHAGNPHISILLLYIMWRATGRLRRPSIMRCYNRTANNEFHRVPEEEVGESEGATARTTAVEHPSLA